MQEHLLSAGLVVALLAPSARPADVTGYVFWEIDGSAPRFRFTVELTDGKRRHRQGIRRTGSFHFTKVAPGRYSLFCRYGDFILADDAVEVSAAGPNFAAIMIPKLRAEMRPFATVSMDRLLQWYTPSSRRKLQQATRLLAEGDTAGATQLLHEVLESTPSADVLSTLGALYENQGRADEAQRRFEQALVRDPKFLPPYRRLASLLLAQGRYQEAASVAARALKADPHWAGAHMLMGAAMFRAGDLETAARHARAASQILQGKSPEAHLLLAKILRAESDCQGARKLLDLYLVLRPSARDAPDLQPMFRHIRSCLSAGNPAP